MSHLLYEFDAWGAGYSHIAGIDEAGRGPLAGPVIAAAVILPKNVQLEGVKDSKRMTPCAREEAFSLIEERAISIALAVVSPREIDQINILQATRKAMKQAVLHLDTQPDFLLIDGTHPVDLPIQQRCIVKGDQQCLSISAASVLAKVYRDRMMCCYHELYPRYGFSSNKGYGTRGHLEAIMRYGPCSIHRLTFRGVVS
ncbi:MAG: ribonuclease HII [Deltaproteobacteria bacterium]|nr:ribonuclease HII [Deltaproteobacteria bacterium]MBW2310904.1 ribonuclease HII [Deltaproteobacteria bacterium]RLB32144.1 MAG: ribonuclease HII [Deltaproteobacteria bacterium]